MLSLRQIVETVGGLHSVDNCTFDVRQGTITGLIVPNGVGKSTAMKALFGLIEVRQDRVQFSGEDITRLSPDRIVGRSTCYAP